MCFILHVCDKNESRRRAISRGHFRTHFYRCHIRTGPHTMFNKTISGRWDVTHVLREIGLMQHLKRVTRPEEPIRCVFYSQKMFLCAHRGSCCSISALWPQEGRHILFSFSTCASVTAFVLGRNWLLRGSYFCRKQPCSFRINTLFIPPFCNTHTHTQKQVKLKHDIFCSAIRLFPRLCAP